MWTVDKLNISRNGAAAQRKIRRCVVAPLREKAIYARCCLYLRARRRAIQAGKRETLSFEVTS